MASLRPVAPCLGGAAGMRYHTRQARRGGTEVIWNAMAQQGSRLSSGVVVVRRVETGCRFLLLRVYRYWDFPKGMVESGEDPLDGARREVREETGLTDLRFSWGLDYRETPPYGHGKVARYYVAETGDSRVVLLVNPALGRPEHDGYRWVTLEEGRRLVVPRVAAVLDWAAAVTGCGPPRNSGGDSEGTATD